MSFKAHIKLILANIYQLLAMWLEILNPILQMSKESGNLFRVTWLSSDPASAGT